MVNGLPTFNASNVQAEFSFNNVCDSAASNFFDLNFLCISNQNHHFWIVKISTHMF